MNSNDLKKEIENLLNRASREGVSNTHDFILAQYLMGCLEAFETAVQQRETAHGRDASPCLSQLEGPGSPNE